MPQTRSVFKDHLGRIIQEIHRDASGVTSTIINPQSATTGVINRTSLQSQSVASVLLPSSNNEESSCITSPGKTSGQHQSPNEEKLSEQ